MSDDFLVRPRPDSEVRSIAKKAREYLGVANHRRVDMVACLKRKSIWTVYGVKRLIVQVLPDIEMGTADGLTTHQKELVIVALKESVHKAAVLGEGRARNTIAHELGHSVLHDRAQMPRRATGNAKHLWIRPFESAEHQANVFAAAFLIDDTVAGTLKAAEEISVEFGVSLKCAEIYYKERTELEQRQRTAEKIRKMAEALIAEVKPSTNRQSIKFIDSRCPQCGKRTVFPVGPKFMCQSCDAVSDTFQDGDAGD